MVIASGEYLPDDPKGPHNEYGKQTYSEEAVQNMAISTT